MRKQAPEGGDIKVVVKTDSKQKQPFAKLPSFLVTATILSYYGYKWEVGGLCQYLSHAARVYFIKHCKNYSGFLLEGLNP
jgi:hypothetical protein